MADFGTVARPYARAIFDLAASSGDLSGWSSALAIAASVLADEHARDLLALPAQTDEDRAGFVAQMCRGIDGAQRLATPEGANLLLLLSENDRLGALAEISQQFDQLKTEAERKVKVLVTSATPINSELAQTIGASLERKLGRSVDLELKIDEALMGGAVIRAEDMVIDGSVRARLERLADSLID